MRTGQGHISIVAAERFPRTPRHRPLQWKILMIHSPELDQLNQCHCVRETLMNYAVYCTVFAILYIHIRACFPGDFRCANCRWPGAGAGAGGSYSWVRTSVDPGGWC